jgi:uracil-DNA glycosylase family 4
MNNGFFNSSLLESKAPQSILPKCGACGLHKKCKSPKLSVAGKGKRKILIISECPSSKDDEAGRMYSSAKPNLPLELALAKAGVNLERDCWLTSALICHTDKEPTSQQIEFCRPNLVKLIKELKPDVIIPLGKSGITSIIPHLWKDNIGTASRWYGFQIPSQQINSWVCPTFSPSYVHQMSKTNDVRKDVLKIHFRKHIQAAVELSGKPFDEIPDYQSQVEIIDSPTQAAKIIRKMIKRGGMVAFDYETDRLKPDNDESKIVSCAICYEGKKTIAYDWSGEAIEATKELLHSSLPKIACNLKFEDRWTRKHFGKRVRNWFWDTMLAAHVIDQRPRITSIKFQSFVLLGASSYDDHIKKYLMSSGTSEVNNIHQIDRKELLIYNGLDAVLEYEVAMKQMKILGYPKPQRL